AGDHVLALAAVDHVVAGIGVALVRLVLQGRVVGVGSAVLAGRQGVTGDGVIAAFAAIAISIDGVVAGKGILRALEGLSQVVCRGNSCDTGRQSVTGDAILAAVVLGVDLVVAGTGVSAVAVAGLSRVAGRRLSFVAKGSSITADPRSEEH